MLQATLWVQLYQKDKKYPELAQFNVDPTIIKIGSFVDITTLAQYFQCTKYQVKNNKVHTLKS